MQTSVHCATNENLAESGAATLNIARKAPHAKARDRIPRQLLTFGAAQLLDAYLCCTERIEAKNLARRCIVDQNENGTDAFYTLLRCVLLQIIIQRWHPTMKCCAIVPADVKNLLFKHA